MEAALDRRELPVRAERFDGVDAFALNGCRPSVRQESVGLSSINTVQAPHSPPSQPVFVPVRPTFSRR